MTHMLEALDRQREVERKIEANAAHHREWVGDAQKLLRDCRDSFALSPELHARVEAFLCMVEPY